MPGFGPGWEAIAHRRVRTPRANRDTAAVAFHRAAAYRWGMNNIRLMLTGAVAAAALLGAAVQEAGAASHGRHRAAAAPAAGDMPKTESLGSAGGWSAYASRDSTGRVCYLAGHPQKSEPGGASRRQPMAMVTHRPTENIANVVSFVEGYTLKPGSDVKLEAGGKSFELFTRDDSAWARTSDLDRTIVETLARGGSAVVKGEPEKGRPTTDLYSLAGFAKALALIDKACGVKRGGAPAAPTRHATVRRRHKPHAPHHR